jgi:hypothetical protein
MRRISHTGLLWKRQEERYRYQDLEEAESIILKWISEKQDGLVWTRLI